MKNNCLQNVTLFDGAVRKCVLDCNNDNVADTSNISVAAAENFDALHTLCTTIVRYVQISLHLYHDFSPLASSLDNFDESPALVLGQVATLHDANCVAIVCIVFLVVSLKLLC